MPINTKIKTDINKDKKIKKELLKLKKLFKDIGKDKLDTVNSLIENAAFMTVTLKELQEDINEYGTISKYQNGENQWGTKKSPEVEVYNSMLKNHMNIIKQLTDLLPKEVHKEDDDGFNAFVGGRDD